MKWMFWKDSKPDNTHEIDELRKELISLRGEVSRLRQNEAQYMMQINSAETDRAALRSKLREQNDADLLLVSVKIGMDIVKGEKPKDSDLLLQNSLLQQRQAGLSGSPYSAFGLGSSGQSLFGAIFGGH